MKTFTIHREDTDKKVASFLKKHFAKTFLHKAFRKRDVKVNDQRVTEDLILKRGDVVKVYERESKKLPGQILFENDDFLVLNKPKGIPVHEGKTVTSEQSLIGKLEKHYSPQKITPFLAHRLDTNTSGCLLIVKKERLLPVFESMFKEGKVRKSYMVLVVGLFKEKKGIIKIPLPGREKHLTEAETHFHVLRLFHRQKVTLLRAQILTGRKHQIRLHMAEIKHPVVLDQQYGDFAFNRDFKGRYKLSTQFLHAESLAFVFQGKSHSYRAPLEKGLQLTLDRLKDQLKK